MGMFDWVRVDMDLPDGVHSSELKAMQTKSLLNHCEAFDVDNNGNLTLDGKPYCHNGLLNFYAEDKSGEWHEYDAWVKNGVIVDIVCSKQWWE